ncbi:MAG: hypothetical protein AABN34_26155 [Acidobacteriota bacterium]
MKEFMLVGTYLSEVIELVEPYKNEERIPDREFEQLQERIFGIQSNRFKQNAKIRAMLVYFSDFDTASRLFDEHTSATTIYLENNIERFVSLKHSLPATTNRSNPGDLKELRDLRNEIDNISDLNEKFSLVVNHMLQDIRTKEEEYAKARF